MSEVSFNPLTAVQAFEDVGIERRQAEAIANAISYSTESAVAKSEFESSITSVRIEVKTVQWAFSFVVVAVFGLITFVLTIGDKYL